MKFDHDRLSKNHQPKGVGPVVKCCLSKFYVVLLCRYMVDKKWFEAWQQYVDYEDINSNDRQHPGPVDNEALFNDADSSEHKGKLVI